MHPRTAFNDWWTLILAQLERARATLPANLRGVIQLEANQTFRFIHLDGPRATATFEGVAISPNVWVTASEPDLRTFLATGTMPRDTLRSFGDTTLLRRFFAALDAAPKQKSWLALRAQRTTQ